MIVKFPQIDQIVHASLDQNAYLQKEYVKLMNQSNNFINLTFQELMDRITREYNSKSIVDMLGMVNVVLDEEKNACPNQTIVYDDFIKNAAIVSQALKNIINNPSTKLIRVTKNVPANKVRKFDSKTMNWLSMRPGITIQEKIAPKNVIPTKVTCFTVDTAENRHTMYLFDILYDYLFDKIFPNGEELPCENCAYKENKCYELYDKLKSIVMLKHKVRHTELQEVLKQKQLRQNNKLLSDKEYKQIWDAVLEIDYYENNCKAVWENLQERYQFMMFILLCAKISLLDGVKVFDFYCQLKDENGRLSINEKSKKNKIQFYDSINDQEYVVELNNDIMDISINHYEQINLVKFVKKNIYKNRYDLSHIFEELNLIEKEQNILEDSVKNLESSKKLLREVTSNIEEFSSKKIQVQKMVNVISKLAREKQIYVKEA